MMKVSERRRDLEERSSRIKHNILDDCYVRFFGKINVSFAVKGYFFEEN